MTVRVRLSALATADNDTGASDTRDASAESAGFGPRFDQTLARQPAEADEFYRSVTPPAVSPDEAEVIAGF